MLAKTRQLISEHQTTDMTPASDPPHTAGVLGKNALASFEIVGNVPA